jgi:SSS family solute:Na+ symporter
MLIFFVFLYLLLQLGIGYYVSKKIKTSDDYFLAGRNLSAPLVIFSLFATWFGSETCIGTAGAVYEHGLSGSRADPIGYAICLFLVGLLLAGKLWSKKTTTLGDFYHQRFGKSVEYVSLAILIPSSLMWAAAQIRAFGQVLTTIAPINVEIGIVFAVCFVMLYTSMGGLLGDIYTDFLQGIMIILGLIITLVMTLYLHPEWLQYFSQAPVARFSFAQEGESLLERIDRFAIPIIGSLITQELTSRILAAKSVKVAKTSAYLAAILYLIIGSIPVFLGFIGPSIFPNLVDSEQFLLKFSQSILPDFLYVIFAGAILSAILSTVDSIFLAISVMISKNMVYPLLKRPSEKQKVLLGRSITIASGFVALMLALRSDGIMDLVEEASAFGSSGLTAMTLFGLYTTWGGAAAALGALMVGILVSLLTSSFLPILSSELIPSPYIASFVLAILVYVIISLFEAKIKK